MSNIRKGFPLAPNPPWKISEWEDTVRAIFKESAEGKHMLALPEETNSDLPVTLEEADFSLYNFYVDDKYGRAAAYKFSEPDRQHWIAIRLEPPNKNDEARYRILTLDGDNTREPTWIVQEETVNVKTQPEKLIDELTLDAQRISTGTAATEHQFMDSMRGLFV
jgi:hypothetical protein